jgi:hypothetical protein
MQCNEAHYENNEQSKAYILQKPMEQGTASVQTQKEV